jgi:hypothetical protein
MSGLIRRVVGSNAAKMDRMLCGSKTIAVSDRVPALLMGKSADDR